LTVVYDGACSPNVSVKMASISFGAFPCKKKNLSARVSMLLKSRVSPHMLPFSLCNNTCNSAHEQTPLSNDTIDSVLQHGEVDRSKGLSAPPRIILPSVACQAQHFSTLSQKRNYFRGGKSYWIQKVCWFPLKLLSQTFLNLRRIQRDFVINGHTFSCKVHATLVRFYSNLTFHYIF